MDTMIKAASVPMLVSSATILMGRRDAVTPVIMMVSIVLLTGVFVLGDTWPNIFGSSPSLDMAKNILV